MAAAGIEAAAANVLRNGEDLENKKRYTEALVCYREGLQLLFDLMKCLYLFSTL
jgi:hypothetical protein